MTHPDYRCPGCQRPIEPLAAIRTYHAGCDPYARIERLVAALQHARKFAWTAIRRGVELEDFNPDEHVLIKEIDAALSGKGE